MRLLDNGLEQNEVEHMKRMLDGNLTRILIGDDVEEVVRNLGFATDVLSMLAYSRVKQLRAKEDSDEKDNSL